METDSVRTVVIDGKELTFVRVKSKEAVGPKHVYDFEVQGVHNYYAEGVNVHNCEFHTMLDDYGKRLGIEFYRKKDVYIKYMYKNLEFYPAGPSKRALRGRTRILTATDEIGWFPVGADNKDRERADADEVYTALDRSLLTMRREVRVLYKKGYSNFLPAIAVNISSPADQADKINRLVNENLESRTCLALRLPTWEITPMYSRHEGEIAEAYRKDPIAAERDYGANPPLNSSRFITKENSIRCFTGLNRVSTNTERVVVNDEYRRYGTISSITPMQPCPATLMSIDAGYSNNSFSATVLYPTQITRGESIETTIHVPVVVEIQPAPGEKLHYSRIYRHVLKPIMEAFNVRYFFADRWNSIAILDTAAGDFANVQLVAKQYSVKYVDFQAVKSYLEEGKIVLPVLDMEESKIMTIDSYPSYFQHAPIAHLLFQMMTVKDMGSTVVKGGVYTDDSFRALTLGVSRVLDPKIMPELIKLGSKVTRPKMIGAVASGHSYGMSVMLPAKQNGKLTALAAPHSALALPAPQIEKHKTNIVIVTRT